MARQFFLQVNINVVEISYCRKNTCQFATNKIFQHSRSRIMIKTKFTRVSIDWLMKLKSVPVEPWCCGSSGHLWSKRIWVLFQLFSKCFSFLGGKVVEKNWKLCDLNIALVDEGFVIPRFKLWDIFGLAATTPLDLDSKPICIVWLFWCLRVGWKKVKWQFVEKLNCRKVILLKSQIRWNDNLSTKDFDARGAMV